MRRMLVPLALFAAGAWLVVPETPSRAAEDPAPAAAKKREEAPRPRKVLVELFTSQG